MKAPQRTAIVAAIKEVVPDLWIKRRLLALMPVSSLLRAVYLEDSSDPLQVYVWAFVQPLYMPVSSIVFTFGKRLGGGSKSWAVAEPARIAAVVRDEGLPFVKEIDSPAAFADWTELAHRRDAVTLEARGRSLVLANRVHEAQQVLQEAVDRMKFDERPWVVERRRRIIEVGALAGTDLDAAKRLVLSEEDITVRALKLERAKAG